MSSALVVFHDHGAHTLNPLLKSGFRHCFCAIQDKNGYWIRFDSRVGRPDIDVAGGADIDLARFWRGHGFTVVETVRRHDAPRGPFVNANCVGLVKVVLCIHTPRIITPWQLFKHLRRTNHGK